MKRSLARHGGHTRVNSWVGVLLVLLAPLSPAARAAGRNGAAAAAAQKGKKKDQPRNQAKNDPVAGLPSLPDDRAIDLAISEMLGAWQVGNTEMLHKYYADDVAVVSGAWELPVVGWPNFLKAYQTQRQRLQGTRLDRRNTFITVRGNLAWAAYQWELAALVDGKPATFHGHTTLILEKRNARWLIVHNHTSLVPEAPTPETPPSPGPTKPGTSPSGRGGA